MVPSEMCVDNPTLALIDSELICSRFPVSISATRGGQHQAFFTRLSNGGPPQVPGTHAGTRGAGEFDGIIAAVKEDEIYYHRDQCDMITMILRLAPEPAWRYERGRQTTPTADRNRRIGGCGTRVIDQACPWERVLYCYFSAPGVLCHFEKAHPSAHGVCYYRATQKKLCFRRTRFYFLGLSMMTR